VPQPKTTTHPSNLERKRQNESNLYRYIGFLSLPLAIIAILLFSSQQDLSSLLLPITCGTAAGLASGLMGAGGGAILIPALILAGIPPQHAIATSKLGALGLTVSSSVRLISTGHTIPLFVFCILMPLSILASLVGSYLLVALDGAIAQRLAGCTILLVMFLTRKNSFVSIIKTESPTVTTTGLVCFFLLTTLQSAFGSGIGATVLLVLVHGLGLAPLAATTAKRLTGICVSAISVGYFAYTGIIYWKIGIIIALCVSFGGYWGTALLVWLGERMAYKLLTITQLASAIFLLFG
jgi:uncharacterized protein